MNCWLLCILLLFFSIIITWVFLLLSEVEALQTKMQTPETIEMAKWQNCSKEAELPSGQERTQVPLIRAKRNNCSPFISGAIAWLPALPAAGHAGGSGSCWGEARRSELTQQRCAAAIPALLGLWAPSYSFLCKMLIISVKSRNQKSDFNHDCVNLMWALAVYELSL